jgi:hypothetical protein
MEQEKILDEAVEKGARLALLTRHGLQVGKLLARSPAGLQIETTGTPPLPGTEIRIWLWAGDEALRLSADVLRAESGSMESHRLSLGFLRDWLYQPCPSTLKLGLVLGAQPSELEPYLLDFRMDQLSIAVSMDSKYLISEQAKVEVHLASGPHRTNLICQVEQHLGYAGFLLYRLRILQAENAQSLRALMKSSYQMAAWSKSDRPSSSR